MRGAPLTREQVLLRLGEHAAGRELLTARWLARNDAVTYRSLLTHFDSFGEACAAAAVAVPARTPRRWSQDLIIKELRRMSKQQIPITAPSLAATGRFDLLNAIRQYIGSVPRARQLVGAPEPPPPGPKRERWDDDRVIHEIRRRRRNGLPLALTKAPSKLVAAACLHCGSWQNAIEMAGLDYSQVRLLRAPWREDEVLDNLRATERANLAGKKTAVGPVVSKLAKRWFGSVWSAARTAEVDPDVVLQHQVLTTEDVADGLRQLASAQPTMTLDELKRSTVGRAARRRYGSVEAALQHVGFTHWPRRQKRRFSHEDTLQQLTDRYARNDSRTIEDVTRDDPGLMAAARKHFGSWTGAHQAAGIPLPGQESWTQEHTLNKLRDRHRRGLPLGLGVAPLDLLSAAIEHFGSWEEALRAAGLDQASRRRARARWSRDAVIAAIQAADVSGRTGIGPQGFLTHAVAFQARRWFGRVEDAVVAAGCDPSRVQRKTRRTDMQIVDELHELARTHPSMTLGEFYRTPIGQVVVRLGKLEPLLHSLGIQNWPRRVTTATLPSREELLAALRSRHERGEAMSQESVKGAEMRIFNSAIKHFGNWRAAMTAAGLGELVGRRARRAKVSGAATAP